MPGAGAGDGDGVELREATGTSGAIGAAAARPAKRLQPMSSARASKRALMVTSFLVSVHLIPERSLGLGSTRGRGAEGHVRWNRSVPRATRGKGNIGPLAAEPGRNT